MSIHPDQLICCQCGHRAISRHNISCPKCKNVVMAYEAAILQIQASKPTDSLQAEPVQVSDQLSLFPILASA